MVSGFCRAISYYLEILYRIFFRCTNLLVELGIESYVFNEHVATIREDLADGLEVDVTSLQDVGGDVEGDGHLAPRLVDLAVQAKVVEVVLEVAGQLSLPRRLSPNLNDLLLDEHLVKSIFVILC